VRDNLDRTPQVALARVGLMWGAYRPGQAVNFDILFERRGAVPSRLGAGAFYFLVPLAVGGVALTRRAGVTVVPFLGPVVMVTWTAAITFGVTRYRVAADVILVVAAAVALEYVVERRARRLRAVEDPGRERPTASARR
ncbi:MAG: hypothetical protein AAGK32_10235, partial [Actinomycetota bacterium]